MPKRKLGNAELISKYIDHLNETKKVSEGTINTYKNIGNGLPFNILTSQPVIIRKLRALYDNPNTLGLHLNMIILLRRFNDEETDKLVKMRNSLRNVIIKSRKENLAKLDETLPSPSYLITQLDNLSGIRYLINYLMINHTLRNKDINLKFVKTLPEEKTENYIYFKGKNAVVYITDYKTESKYGDKVIKVDSPRFIRELKQMKLKDGDYLLSLKNGDKITSPTTFNDKMVKLTIDGLGQNKIAKIIIKNLLTNKSFSKLEQLSRDRGTSLEVMLKSYNLHNTKPDERRHDSDE